MPMLQIENCFINVIFLASKCSVNFLSEEDKLIFDTSSPSDAIDLLTTSDNRIGLFLTKVVAITVFCLLVVAFYAFFAPFLGGRIWEYALVATYSLVFKNITIESYVTTIILGMAMQALLVFILYVRCIAINPADPGIMSKFNGGTNKFDIKHGLSVKDLPRKFDEFGSGLHSSPSTVSRSSIAAPNSSKKGSAGDPRTVDAPAQSVTGKSCCIGGIFCALFVHEGCCKQEGASEQGSEDALFCT
ncbi:hypothetical protein REPUB_Repub17cG0046400 [Reevesia pubescens]